MKRLKGQTTSGFSRVVLILGLLMAAIGIGAGGMAIAGSSSEAQIVSCVRKDTGAVRVLSSTKSGCVDGEYKLAWNVQGPPGTSFNGSYVSPNGLYSLVVNDSGIILNGPTGGVTVNTAGVTVNAQAVTLQSSGQTRINGSTVALNCASGGGRPVARVADQVINGQVATGSTTVLAC